MSPEELAALGVYDPQGPNAALRLELLDYLVSLGASAEELVTFKDMLPALAGRLAIQGGPALSLEVAADRSGVTVDRFREMALAAGIPDPEPDVPVFTEGFVAFASGMNAVGSLFGEDASTQLTRVMGSAMARVADALVSSFLVNVASPVQHLDPVGIGIARANVEATSLLPLVGPAFEALLRQHLLLTQRELNEDAAAGQIGFETRHLVVAFVDIVGSTGLSGELSMTDLGATLNEFEQIASDSITEGGGRMVKLIGDEILYTAPDALSALSIALDLADAFQDHAVVPQVRAGLASGDVMLRDGDVFGPVVNLASRIADVGQPGEVVATAEVVQSAGLPCTSLGTRRLSGINEPVELYRLGRL